MILKIVFYEAIIILKGSGSLHPENFLIVCDHFLIKFSYFSCLIFTLSIHHREKVHQFA